jgi:hypothetical protein
MALPRASGQVEAVMRCGSHTDLPCHPVDRLRLDLSRRGGEASVGTVEQEKDGKALSVRPSLGHDERQVRRCQGPALGDVPLTAVQVAKLPTSATTAELKRNAAFPRCKSLSQE